MITPESTDTALDASQSTRSWVWHSTDDSIAAGQISVLSVVETFCALGLYGWLAFHFEHQWWLLISAVAAPIILLRSPRSKHLGIKLLMNYNHKFKVDWKNLLKREKVFTAIFISILSASLLLASHKVLSLSTIKEQALLLYGQEIILWFLTTIIAFIVTFAVTGIVGISAFAGAVSGIAHISLGLGAALIAIIFTFLIKSSKKPINRPLLLLISISTFMFAIGVWLRTLSIRMFATLRHPINGLRHLNKNLNEILWTIDATHPPELLPDAHHVNDFYSIKNILQIMKNKMAPHWWLNGALILCWYPPALLWRWSLKATLWLWFPLALLLRPPFEGKSLEQVRDIAAIRVVVSKWLGFVALLGILLLAVGYIPSVQAWVDTLGDSISKPFTKLAEFHLPPPGLRQWALWLCCGLAGLEWLSLVLLQARHKKLLEEEDSIYGGIPEIRLQTFLQRARKVQWLHTALVVSFILLGYTIVLHLANTWYPAELARFIPAWLIGWL